MKGEIQGKGKVEPPLAAVISVLDRNAGLFHGRRARLSRVRALRAPPKAPLTAAPRPQDGRRAIKDGPCVDGPAWPRMISNAGVGRPARRQARRARSPPAIRRSSGA